MSDQDEANDELEPSETPEAGDPGAPGAGTIVLGLERWVLLGYMCAFAVAFWLFDNIITMVWDQFAEPQEMPIVASAALTAVIVTVILYYHKSVNAFANEAAAELSKVSWPDRKETWSNTVVVIVTSFIAAIILFSFDAVWSWVTDLIYL
jgi:preprotein translocase SecE subunit